MTKIKIQKTTPHPKKQQQQEQKQLPSQRAWVPN